MAYFDYPQLQILEQFMDRYKEAFPDCDLTKRAENIGLKEAFRKDEYFETMKGDVLDRIHEGFYDEDDKEVEFSDDDIDSITRRVINWMDYSSLNETIDEAVYAHRKEQEEQLQKTQKEGIN